MNEYILEVDFPMCVHKELNTHWGATFLFPIYFWNNLTQVNNPLSVQHIMSIYPAIGGFYRSVIMNNSSKNKSVKYLYDTQEFIWIYDQY